MIATKSKKTTNPDLPPLDQVKTELGYDPNGLSEADAKQRLAQTGYNELVEKKVNPIVKFLSYFWGPIPWMIEVAAILSLVVRHWADFGIILALLVVNAIVGFWEEFQAGNTITALKERLAPEAHVRRDGRWQTIPARELVPGDLIRLRLGEIVPA
ncbi:MAG: cation-transporting P-type ATPase, partial [Chloroflexota bacterium]